MGSSRRHTLSNRWWRRSYWNHKALQELQDLGWISKDKMPRLVAVQSEGCAPIVRAWEQGKSSAEPWKDAETVAFGINVANALTLLI